MAALHRYEVHAALNFGGPVMREEFVRVDDENPPKGGGAGPYVPETQQGGIRPIPFGPQTTRAVRDGRTENGALLIWLTPHGFLKGAAANTATVRAGQRGAQVVSFTAFNGKYPISGTLNAQNLVERVETRVSNPLYGDMALEAVYSDYRDINGVKFPMHIVQRQGGFPTFDLRVSGVQPNSGQAASLTAPPRPAGAPAAEGPARATAKELAPGFWALEGAIPMSFLIEFRDHVVVIEAPGNEERTEAMLAEVKRVTPNKPIRYVVNTPHHSDHSGGLRAVVAEGIPILTHQSNKAYYEKLFRNPSQIVPDRLSRAPKAAVIEGVGDKRVLTDGTRSVSSCTSAGTCTPTRCWWCSCPRSECCCRPTRSRRVRRAPSRCRRARVHDEPPWAHPLAQARRCSARARARRHGSVLGAGGDSEQAWHQLRPAALEGAAA